MANYFKSISDFSNKYLNILVYFEFRTYTHSHIHIFMHVYVYINVLGTTTGSCTCQPRAVPPSYIHYLVVNDTIFSG